MAEASEDNRGPVDQVSILDDIPDTALVPVELQAGDWLFHAGDEGDAMYIVVQGRLEVHIGEHVVANSARATSWASWHCSRGNLAARHSELDATAGSWSWTRTASTRWRFSSRKFPWPWLGRWLGACSGWKPPRSKPSPARVLAIVGAEGEVPLAAVSASLVSALGVHLRPLTRSHRCRGAGAGRGAVRSGGADGL